jgi:ATP-dependent DNA helicase RecG
MDVYSDIGNVKGIGPKMKELLNCCGIFSIIDLLLYFPRDYENIAYRNNIKMATDGEKIIINCRFLKSEEQFRGKSGKIVTKLMFTDGETIFYGTWFNMPFIKNSFIRDKDYTLMGKIKILRGELSLNSPIIIQGEVKKEENLIPIYPLKENLKNPYLIKTINYILSQIKIDENMPKWVVENNNFVSLDKAIRNIHSPKNLSELNEAKRRLKFQELFSYSLKILMLKKHLNEGAKGIAFKISKELVNLKEKLPYDLTAAQSRVVREILIDEKKPIPMNRLVQGDVGSGKTVVALIALFNVIKNGFQTVLLAPTEILANQHYAEALKLYEGFDINVELLTGSLTNKKKLEVKEKLLKGEIQLIIGTHALFEENVVFEKLGMIVTDEQHRFGVKERSRLFNKGENVDVLVMTATPIPRTLGLCVYGDLDISTIDELPKGRKKVETYYVQQRAKDKVYNFALDEIKKGRQVYVVCPLVEENEKLELNSVEKLVEQLRNIYFKNEKVEMIHGKMPPKNKDEIMKNFKNGEIDVLVSTTVIEVGVNVPNASVMIIENAERFGLSQLHQLRGRVGRGNYQSYCILVSEIKSNKVKNRLEIMKRSNDGFYIAEEDLKIRGTGEIFGYRQHGDNGLILSDIIEDAHLLIEANKEAKLLLKSNEENDIRLKNDILKKLTLSSKYICFN